MSDFVRRVPGVAHGVVVSGGGSLLGRSDGLPQQRAEQLAGVVAGLIRTTSGAAEHLSAGRVHQAVLEMERGYMLLMTAGDGSCFAVLASPRSEMGTVAYELALLVDRVEEPTTQQPDGVQDD
ncbi:roadblock/LC7 domain-containing protein [Haloechinothrix sp. LS1_15]|uniref:roadblock/LC7 domain-containing protein n=1 Tax=Haloechinothrix sp. LS1_15 TaxID=2652248 RepID=UPI0029440100|nr:roadblock/LC7 domain-containing protein [Haloechinothrix sp. LS1_15]MDV6014388.1 roadblock/LC7 domain-containing protein [Haloechinothrix sp. LS1_15]